MQLHLLPPGLALLEIPAVRHQQRVHRDRRQHRPNRVHEHGLLERPRVFRQMFKTYELV